MSEIINNFASFLDENDIHYKRQEGNDRILRITNSLEDYSNVSVHIYIIEEDDNDSGFVKLLLYGLGHIEELKYELLVKFNEINYTYRWIKIYTDKDNDIMLNDDLLVKEDSNQCIMGKVCLMLKIANEIYPQLMKAIWS